MYFGSGRSKALWLEERGLESSPRLEKNSAAHTCVIGAGVAGLTTAYLLAGKNASVIVVDDGEIGGGETSRTTAHLSNALDDGFASLERIRGRNTARVAAESHMAAINLIEAIQRDENIACGFRRLDGYLFGTDLDREYEAAYLVGADVEWAERAPAMEIDSGRCLRFRGQGQFDPLAYLNGLAAAAVRRGVEIYCGARAVGMDTDRRLRVHLETGGVIECERAVVATNSPVFDRLALQTKLYPYRTYAISAPVPTDAHEDALLWDNADPYHYVRFQTEGAARWIVVGGEDHKTAQGQDAGNRWRALEEWARARFPRMGPVRHRWSGQVLETLDGLAYIGREPGQERVFVATGDSGMGMTHGTIAGMLLSDLATGLENPWSAAYAPERKPLVPLREYLSENLNVAAQFLDYVGAHGGMPEPGEGSVVREGLGLVAVHRDERGELVRRSAVCPHMKCAVRWNAAEGTWDCPCHGSRFRTDGRAVNGPANRDLDPP